MAPAPSSHSATSGAGGKATPSWKETCSSLRARLAGFICAAVNLAPCVPCSQRSRSNLGSRDDVHSMEVHDENSRCLFRRLPVLIPLGGECRLRSGGQLWPCRF